MLGKSMTAMDWASWEPVYAAIRADFGFDEQSDQLARDRLATLIDPQPFNSLPSMTERTVAVVAPGPSLSDELALVERADHVIAVSNAADMLREKDLNFAIHVTDLDKNPSTSVGLTRAGIPTVIHAHGDNIPALERYLPQCQASAVFGSTQAEPSGAIFNVGGFTDGDRGAFLGDALGAKALTFPGWDLSDSTLDTMKARKLTWARRLLQILETRRGEHFSLLDGHRRDLAEYEWWHSATKTPDRSL